MTIPVQQVQDRCRETAGFLFSHLCKNPATGRCCRCGKPICADHTRPASTGADPSAPIPGGSPEAGGTVCIGCARRQVFGAGPSQEHQGLRADPFFCAWVLGGTTGDYTEEDHEAFDVESLPAGAEDWERDWDAS